MQKHLDLSRQRLRQFQGRLRGQLYVDRAPVTLAAYAAPDRIPFAEVGKGYFRPVELGEKLGPAWSTHWIRVALEVPFEWNGREVHFLWDSCSEACVWLDGEPQQGLTGSNGGPAHRADYCLLVRAQGGQHLTLFVEVACNHLFGAGMNEDVGNLTGTLKQAEIACFDRAAWDLLWDYTIIMEMAIHLPEHAPRAGQALAVANQMVNLIALDDRTTWTAARTLAAKFLAEKNGDSQHQVSAVGHAHIDTAWLWPLAETRRKCCRTFASAVRYMDLYPDYKFAVSQAQQWEWMKESYPGLYQRMRQKVKSGQFCPAGGTWVEPDCNIPSGESLVRQFLLGQQFFRREFGACCTEFWNPDVFGYSGQLPQIMKGAGADYFLTQKLSWNQFNKLPSHTFIWEGIDGSQVLAHFPPADTYGGDASVGQMLHGVRNYKDHERSRRSYYLYGYSDGGGGPTLEMLERLQRMTNVDGLPKVSLDSPHEFFTKLKDDLKDPLVWVGELYFELHRGTYTTQARNKYFNRRCEKLLRDIELLSAVNYAWGRSEYPGQQLERLWKLVLVNQFHDIIPGSSITQVYLDSTDHYKDVLRTGRSLCEDALDTLVPGAGEEGPRVAVVNTLGWPRREVVELPLGVPAGGQQAGHGKCGLGVVSVPPLGLAILEPTPSAEKVTAKVANGQYVLANDFLAATFRSDGRLVRLLDKRANREVLAPGSTGNNLVFFDDHPINFDAWDVDAFHLESRTEAPPARSARIVEEGPLRASLCFEYPLSDASSLKQTVTLTAVSPRLDFANEVEWHEECRFLKVEFPVNVRSPQAAFEIQFGHVYRPTHFNTSWDLARFEVCAHHWMDLSEAGYGVAVLNNCKYGHAVHGNVMRLSLLRSPKAPDPQADMGRHSFSYAILPHAGTLQEAGIVAQGYCFNVPLLLKSTAAPLSLGESWLTVDQPGVVVDTVKKTEDGRGLIVRLYEAHGGRCRFLLRSSLPIKRAARCNLLEEEEDQLDWRDGGVELMALPFRILTVKLSL